MKRIFNIAITCAAAWLAAGCTPDAEIRAHAGFTTDKEEYRTGDLVTITNTASADNAEIAVCKWEYMGQTLYDLGAPEPFYVDEGGDFLIRQTVTTNRGSQKDVFEKTIRVIDDNTPPVADFTWKVGGIDEGDIQANQEVEFIDRSTDPDEDGAIVAWEWSRGGRFGQIHLPVPRQDRGKADRHRQPSRQNDEKRDDRRGEEPHEHGSLVVLSV